MKRKTAASLLVSALALVMSTLGVVPAHAVSAGPIAISCKIDIVFPVETKQNAQDCVGTADGVAVVIPGPAGDPENIVVAQGNPLWAAGKVTQPCGGNPKPNGGGKCYDNFRAYDIMYLEASDAAGFANGRFEIKCFDIVKNEACVINGSFEYTRVGAVAAVVIPAQKPIKDTKNKGATGVQIKWASGKRATCTATAQGAGVFAFVPKGVPAPPPGKTTFWITGAAAVVC